MGEWALTSSSKMFLNYPFGHFVDFLGLCCRSDPGLRRVFREYRTTYLAQKFDLHRLMEILKLGGGHNKRAGAAD